MPLQLINVFNEVENLVHKKVEIYNDKVKKSVGVDADGHLLPTRTSIRGDMTKNKSTYGPLLIDEVKESEI